MEVILLTILIFLLGILISSLPLFIAVNMLGGHATILNVLLTNIIVGLLTGWLVASFGAGTLIILLVTIFLYSFIFKMGMIRSLFAWLIQYVVAAILIIIVLMLFGISILI
jgi:hypothetical protein|tara:strand:- start:225 stop:557 length:333 start_codon:yes stop_codon:yes gene_type:complete